MITAITTMSEAVLLRLFAWLSPAFPTGGFAYSSGLERAVADQLVNDATGLQDWLETLLVHGSPWNEAVLFAEAWRNCGDGEKIAELSQLAEALAGAAERHRETVDQGGAFLAAARHWFEPGALPGKAPLPVAMGMACGLSRIDLETGPMAYLQAFVSNQLQAAIRLTVVGQDGAARLLAALEPAIAETASRAANASVDDLGGCAFMAEIAAMDHETMQSRLFLS
jgi:urease accessory protein